MTLTKKADQDNALMHVLRINEIAHVLAQTDKGVLTLRLRKGETAKDYTFVLDSVPYTKDVNDKLLELFDGILWEKETIE